MRPLVGMDVLEDLTKWAVARGVKLDGIAAHKFPGKGLGVIAEENLCVRCTFLHTSIVDLAT